MDWVLSEEETRVMGVLMEKRMTTPEYYPLTANGLRTGCNQKTNRFPVVDYSEEVIMQALDKLRAKQLVYIISGSGSRVRKYEHRLKETLHLSEQEQAVLSVLMLRGLQTVGEIRSRTERMAEFAGLQEVEDVLSDLMSSDRKPQPLVTRLQRMPGQKDHRYGHLLAGPPDETLIEQQHSSQPAASRSNQTQLEERVRKLEEELQALQTGFAAFKKQFE